MQVLLVLPLEALSVQEPLEGTCTQLLLLKDEALLDLLLTKREIRSVVLEPLRDLIAVGARGLQQDDGLERHRIRNQLPRQFLVRILQIQLLLRELRRHLSSEGLKARLAC